MKRSPEALFRAHLEDLRIRRFSEASVKLGLAIGPRLLGHL